LRRHKGSIYWSYILASAASSPLIQPFSASSSIFTNCFHSLEQAVSSCESTLNIADTHGTPLILLPLCDSTALGAPPPHTQGPLDNVALITLAPELQWATSVVKGLTDRGIVVSLGHSCGNICHGVAAFQSGARCITHLFNAMTSFHHRDPGLVGMLMYGAQGTYPVYYGLVVDGYHTHVASQHLAYSMHPKGTMMLGAGDSLGL